MSPNFPVEIKGEELQTLWGDLLRKPTPLYELLQVVLKAVRDLFEFNSSLIYLANYTTNELICHAEYGCEAVGTEHGPPRYAFDGHSFACQVFQRKHFIVSNEPWLDDAVDQKGVRFFDVKASVVGVPLKHEDRVLGVLVAWNKTTPAGLIPVAGRLELFAKFAASHLAVSAALEKRVTAVEQLPKLLTQAMQDVSQEAVLKAIMEALVDYPFDRVRLFEYHMDPPIFTPVASHGLTDPHKFLQARILVSDNPYARHVLTSCRENPKPRLYTAAEFGPDPDSDALEKDTDLAWAVAPLVLHGALIGQILVDNGITHRTIAEDALDYLHAMSATAVSIIGNRRSIQFLSLNSLPLLYSSLSPASSRLDVIKKLLVYLTCGESLGFSRGVYLEWKDKSERFVYQTSIGSLTEEQFRSIGANASRLGLSDILRDAPNLYDYEIDEKLRGFSIDMVERAAQELLTGVVRTELHFPTGPPSSISAVPVWSEDLAARIGEGVVLTVVMRIDERILGMFIVDRRWQPQPIRGVDIHVLRTFAEVAARIMEQNELQLESVRRRIDESWENIAYYAAHQCNGPVNDIRLRLEVLEHELKQNDQEGAKESIDSIRLATERLTVFIRDYKLLTESIRLVLHPVALALLLKEVRDALDEDLRSKEIECRIECPNEVVVAGDRERLKDCFREMMANSIYWCDKEKKYIHIEVNAPAGSLIPVSLDHSTQYAVIHIEDNGPGIDPNDEDKIFDPRFTKRANDGGTGIGLYMVRRIITAHGGTVVPHSRLGYYTVFAVFLPLQATLTSDERDDLAIQIDSMEDSACTPSHIQS